MNLHNIVATSRWFWLETRGRNGRSNGTHLFELRPTVRPANEARPAYMRNRNWYMSPHFGWRPYGQAANTLMNNGWVRPLCGKTSASTRPYAQYLYREVPHMYCQNCVTRAALRGILGHIYNNFAMIDPETLQAEREERAWQEAGAPDPETPNQTAT